MKNRLVVWGIAALVIAGCAETTAPRGQGSGRITTATGAEATRVLREMSAARAAAGDSSLAHALDPERAGRSPYDPSTASMMTETGWGQGISSAIASEMGIAKVVSTTRWGGDYNRGALSMTAAFSRNGTLVSQESDGREGAGDFEDYGGGPTVRSYAILKQWDHNSGCGVTATGSGTHSAYTVINGVRSGPGFYGTSAKSSSQQPCDSGECNQTVARPDRPQATDCSDPNNPGDNDPGNGGGGGGSGGSYYTVTVCWGYDYYEDGFYQYSVIEGCSSYTYFIPAQTTSRPDRAQARGTEPNALGATVRQVRNLPAGVRALIQRRPGRDEILVTSRSTSADLALARQVLQSSPRAPTAERPVRIAISGGAQY